MSEPGIAYVCVRPEHHRHRSPTPRLTKHQECCAFCPADRDEGHEWTAVPETTLDAMEEMGWIAPGAAQRCREEIGSAERETVPR